jgi:uncharacterized protein YgbK (DUF1537 family)
MNDPLLAFYGDDFTGSTDAMDALSKTGIQTVLFLEPPTQSVLNKEFPDVKAVGVAGRSRSMRPAEMDEVLPDIYEDLAALDVPLVHYKICSTFDSSPEIGSIGRAIDIAAVVFEPEVVPVVPAAPPLGRYVVFGNIFARDGEIVYRLDRHPTMRDHPVTPMDESDLRRHLGKQTERSIDLLPVLALQSDVDEAERHFDSVLETDPDIVLFDGLDRSHLRTAGELIWERFGQRTAETSFVVGSSGVEYALADYWEVSETLKATPHFDPLPPTDRLFVLSGSASPLTATQINTAVNAGFTDIRIDTGALVDPATARDEFERVSVKARSALADGDSVIVYTAHGPEDDAISETKERVRELSELPSGLGDETELGAYLGRKQGKLLREVVSETALDRVGIAGGDTCGHVTPYLDVYALRSRFPLAPGAPLCTARSRTDEFDGIEIALKGGQLGGDQYFVRARDGADSWKP